MDDIQLHGHYWDLRNEVPKYEIEYNKERLKTSRMEQYVRKNKYEMHRLYKWKITPDVEDNNFEPLVSKVIESTQSWFINGCGGSGVKPI